MAGRFTQLKYYKNTLKRKTKGFVGGLLHLYVGQVLSDALYPFMCKYFIFYIFI